MELMPSASPAPVPIRAANSAARMMPPQSGGRCRRIKAGIAAAGDEISLTEVISEIPDKSCEVILRNVPIDIRSAVVMATFLPYSRSKICAIVKAPLQYSGFAKLRAITMRPIPPPIVNHHAEKP